MSLFSREPKKTNLPITRRPHEVLSLQDQVNRIFDNFFTDWSTPTSPEVWRGRELAPSMEVKESETKYEVAMELPGVSEKDLEIQIEQNVLTVTGEKKSEKEENDEAKGYYCTERNYGKFSRSVSFDKEINEDKVNAQLKDGVLKVTLEKTPTDQRSTKKIRIDT